MTLETSFSSCDFLQYLLVSFRLSRLAFSWGVSRLARGETHLQCLGHVCQSNSTPLYLKGEWAQVCSIFKHIGWCPLLYTIWKRSLSAGQCDKIALWFLVLQSGRGNTIPPQELFGLAVGVVWVEIKANIYPASFPNLTYYLESALWWPSISHLGALLAVTAKTPGWYQIPVYYPSSTGL